MSEEKQEREHSKFSASGSERWLNCPGSVEAEEASPPSPDNEWSLEGTKAHDLLEKMLHVYLYPGNEFGERQALKRFEAECTTTMKVYVRAVYWEILELHKRVGGELIAEQRISQSFIHPEMFGTLDVGIIVPFKELHVVDLKYGKNHVVSPTGNTQMIQYALGLAEKYEWNFDDIWLHIMQPRCAKDVKHWHKKWKMSARELYKNWLPYFREGVRLVEEAPELKAGNWCYWCRAKKTCPEKTEKLRSRVTNVFKQNPI